MARLIIHVGTHKTGTTSIQSFFVRSRSWLAAQGVAYPEANAFAGSNPRSHHGLAAALARSGPFSKELERFRTHLRAAFDRDMTVLLSSESFFGHVIPSGKTSDRQPKDFWSQREAYLDRMKEYFEEFAPRISIYFRNPVSYAESRFSNNIMATNGKWDFENYLKNAAPAFDYARNLDAFTQRFPHVTVQSFERSVSRGLLTAFCADHGLPAPPSEADRRLRTAAGNRAVLWMLRLKAEGEVSKRDRERRWRFALLEEGQAIFDEPTPSMFWRDLDHRAAFFKNYGIPIAGCDFAPPKESPDLRRTIWNDELHAAANAAYSGWAARNDRSLRVRERWGLMPFEEMSDRLESRASESYFERKMRGLRRRWRHVTGG